MQELFSQFGTPITIQNLCPLDLSEKSADSVFLVTKGCVELFYVKKLDDTYDGRRQHMVSIDTHRVFWSLGKNLTEGRIIATGIQDTEVLSLPITRLQSHYNPGEAPLFLPAIDSWVEQLSAFLVDATVGRQRQIEKIINSPESFGVDANQRTGGNAGPLWFKPQNPVRFLGQMEQPGNAWFPCARGSWFSSSDEVWVEAREIAQLPTRELLDALDSFHAHFCDLMVFGLSFEVAESSSKDYRAAASQDAVNRLLAITEDESSSSPMEETYEERNADPLLMAVRKVAAAQRILVHPPPGMPLTTPDNIDSNMILLARNSGFRFRPILLTGTWWQEDRGPIVGFRIRMPNLSLLTAKRDTPIAILTSKPGSYTVWDLKDEHGDHISPNKAAMIHPQGFSLYPSLPDGEVDVKTFLKFAVRGLKSDFLIICLLSILGGILSLLSPILIGKIFDSVIPSADTAMLWQYVGILSITAVAAVGFEMVKNVSILRVECRMDYAGQSGFWSRLLDLPMSFFTSLESGESGDLAERAKAVDEIRSIVSRQGVTVLVSGFVVITQTVFMFFVSWKLALTGSFLIISILLLSWFATRAGLHHLRRYRNLNGETSGLVLQLLSGIEKIRLATAENHAIKKWANTFAEQIAVWRRIGRVQNFVQMKGAFYPILCSMVLFFVYAKMKAAEGPEDEDTLSTGQFIAFNFAFVTTLGAAIQMGNASLSLLEVIPIFERARPILTAPPEVTMGHHRHPGELRGNIELKDVNFRYVKDGDLILKNLSFTIRQGEFIAFVGASGSGKSTILRLLLGFLKPETGRIWLDGQDISTLDAREIRRQVGSVMQTYKLLPVTIEEYIRGGNTSLTRQDVEEAARKACIEQIGGMNIGTLFGIRMRINPGNPDISGGEVQRILIAKALAKKPRIILFDEATSALDNPTQKRVMENLRKIDATRIIVAHRLSTIMEADRIMVMKDGQIVESGKYGDLISLGGEFSKLQAEDKDLSRDSNANANSTT